MTLLLATHITCHGNRESKDARLKAGDIIGGDRIIASSATVAEIY